MLFHRHTDVLLDKHDLPSPFEQCNAAKIANIKVGEVDETFFVKRVVFTFCCTKCGRVRQNVLP